MRAQRGDYAVYGLTVSSDLELPELRVAGEEATADVDVRRAKLETIPGADTDPDIQRIEASPDRCRITYEALGTFLIESGKQILYDPVTSETKDQKIFRRLLENQAMTVLLLQRGLLVLHASAASVNGEAVVFLGAQTAGKSTMTAACHKNGHAMIADDVVAVRFGDGPPMVVPGVPQIRLDAETFERLGIDGTVRYEHDWGPEKRYQPIDDQAPAVPLGKVYTLHENEVISVETLDGSAAFFQLVVNTYAQGLLSDTDATTDHFEQCATLLRTTPVRQLNRPKRYDRLPEVLDLVAGDVQTETTATNVSANTE
jgi:hypothetical protein